MDSEACYTTSMAWKSLDELISAAVPDLDSAIPTTRVQLAIVDSETTYITSMFFKSSNELVGAQIPHLDVLSKLPEYSLPS